MDYLVRFEGVVFTNNVLYEYSSVGFLVVLEENRNLHRDECIG